MKALSDTLKVIIAKDTRGSHPLALGERSSIFVKLLSGADRAPGSLRRKRRDEIFHLDGFIRQRAARSFSGRFLNVPALGHQAIKTVTKAEFRLDGEVGQVVQREEDRVLVSLSLSGLRAIRAKAL